MKKRHSLNPAYKNGKIKLINVLLNCYTNIATRELVHPLGFSSSSDLDSVCGTGHGGNLTPLTGGGVGATEISALGPGLGTGSKWSRVNVP